MKETTKLKYPYNMNLTKLVIEIEEIPTKAIDDMDENIYNLNRLYKYKWLLDIIIAIQTILSE